MTVANVPGKIHPDDYSEDYEQTQSQNTCFFCHLSVFIFCVCRQRRYHRAIEHWIDYNMGAKSGSEYRESCPHHPNVFEYLESATFGLVQISETRQPVVDGIEAYIQNADKRDQGHYNHQPTVVPERLPRGEQNCGEHYGGKHAYHAASGKRDEDCCDTEPHHYYEQPQ